MSLVETYRLQGLTDEDPMKLINTVVVARHSDGSWRFETPNGLKVIYDGNEANINALLESLLVGCNEGLPDPAILTSAEDDDAESALFGNTDVTEWTEIACELVCEEPIEGPTGPDEIVLGPDLENFRVLAGSTVTNTGGTTVANDLGLSPGTSIVGFPPGIIAGTEHNNDTEAADAQLALTAAYNDAAGRAPGLSVSGNLGGLTLYPGTYTAATSLGVTAGALTLDALGNADAVFLFQIGSTWIMDPGTSIVLAGGALAENVFFQVGSSATLDTTVDFHGVIMALTSITVNTGATVEGNLLARNGAVTLDTNVVSA